MGLSGHEILDIILLIYYVPALFLSLFVTRKHGFGRQVGWIFLAILSILRIVGAATGLAAGSNPSSVGLVTCSLVCYSIGLSPLLLALQGILLRVNKGLHSRGGLPPLMIHLASLPILVGLIIGIVAGTKEFDSNPATVRTGYSLGKAASVLFLVGYLALVLMTANVFAEKTRTHDQDAEQRLVLAALLSFPFLAVRIAYALLVSFDHSSSTFNLRSTANSAVVAQALMSMAMEFVVVAIYLTAGLSAGVVEKNGSQQGFVQRQPQQRQRPSRLHRFMGGPDQENQEYKA